MSTRNPSSEAYNGNVKIILKPNSTIPMHSVLAENIPLNKYKRPRLSQSFESPEAKRAREEGQSPTEKKHSPNFDHVQWDKEKVLDAHREL